MKKLLIGILAVLLLVVGAVLVIPSLIDWNTYKAEIAQRIGAATGRAVTLEGNIDLALLPGRPVGSGARLANLPGASEPDMVRLRKLDVRIAFMPLLRGHVQVQSVALIGACYSPRSPVRWASQLGFRAHGERRRAGQPAGRSRSA